MDKHNFSGWPGAYCLKCSAPDPHEEHFDWWKIEGDDARTAEIVYDSEEHKKQIEKENICNFERYRHMAICSLKSALIRGTNIHSTAVDPGFYRFIKNYGE